ncbi:haloalkane dehalogenase [Legionella israelensis]|uniref:haloalkane dehalogenase n=1 Tax=Legionella israelensis TaxID=454 RepID=UPI001FCFFE76|nr:haloalkane dehalogenase [Legionella israelensis]
MLPRLSVAKKLNQTISSNYSFKSHFINVNGAKMHYVDEGEGKPILFIHGMPSSSYLWRNIIPQFSTVGRCIAVDLIGHGKSDSPDNIEYTVKDHLNYLTQFIKQLDLKDITIVGHSWGSTLGIAYARNNEMNVKALSYLEPMLGAWQHWKDFNPHNHQTQEIFQKFRSQEGWDLIVNQNFFLEQIFVNGSLRTLSQEEKDGYINPFKPIERRKAAWKAPRELPVEGQPADVVELVEANFKWLKESTIPQLFFYTNPAAFFTKEKAKKFAQQATKVTLHYLGKGVYNHTEDYPYEVANTLSAWIKNGYTLEKAVPKFSLYTTIHKAIRKEIFETCSLAGTTDFSDYKSLTIFLDRFNSLLDLLRKHSIHEDTFIHPLLAEKKLSEFELLNIDHQELEEQLQNLEQALDQVLSSESKTTMLELGNKFYLSLSQFASQYLQHLAFEETKIMDVLYTNYDLSELMQFMNKFKKSQSNEEAMQSLSLMLTAINPAEGLSMLINIQKSVPYEVFQNICQMAQQRMSADNWEKIDAQLSTESSKVTENLQQFSAVMAKKAKTTVDNKPPMVENKNNNQYKY